MRKLLIFVFTAVAVISCKSGNVNPDIYVLGNPADTSYFKQAPFEWHVTPRHDYSQTYVIKLFMSQALFDGDYMGRYKMHDNGLQTNYLNCEDALEIIKGMDAITCGFPKIVYLVGWQYLGHDSKYPAFFEGNEAIKRDCDADALESMRWLMEEARKYNTSVSVHVNMFDCYTDSPLFDEYVAADVLAKDKGGNLLHGDWGYKVSYTAEWNAGLTQKRLDSLCRILPIAEAGTLHIDAFHNTVPTPYINEEGEPDIKLVAPISPWHGFTEAQDVATQLDIVKFMDAKGIDITIEGVGEGDYARKAFDGYIPMYWHYGNREHQLSLKPTQACGGNNYGVLRCFGYNANGESLFREARTLAEGLDAFKGAFCKSTLIASYLNRFGRIAMVVDEGEDIDDDDDDMSIGIFEDGVRTLWKDGYVNVSRNGVVLAENGDVFIPAPWVGDGAIIAYSENGYSGRTWTLPEGTAVPRNAAAYTLDADGRSEFHDFRIKGRSVTMSLEPDQMVIICPDRALTQL